MEVCFSNPRGRFVVMCSNARSHTNSHDKDNSRNAFIPPLCKLFMLVSNYVCMYVYTHVHMCVNVCLCMAVSMNTIVCVCGISCLEKQLYCIKQSKTLPTHFHSTQKTQFVDNNVMTTAMRNGEQKITILSCFALQKRCLNSFPTTRLM